jgi:glutaminyl-tRNA synthetase
VFPIEVLLLFLVAGNYKCLSLHLYLKHLLLAYSVVDMTTPSSDANPLIALFQSIGLTEAKAMEATKSPKSATVLRDVIEKHALTSRGLGDKPAGLIVTFAICISKASTGVEEEKRGLVLDGIVQGKLKTVDQVNGGFLHLRRLRIVFFRPSWPSGCKVRRDTSTAARREGI